MWQQVALKELFHVCSSKRVLKSQWQKEGVPFYRGREVTSLSKHGFVDNELFISEDLYSEYAKKHGVPQPNDIVITAIGTIGNSYVVREGDRFYFKDASVLWLKKASDVDSEFINLWLKSPSLREQLDEGNGATVDTLTIKKLQSVLVSLPSLDEQRRIVATLTEAFAEIDKAHATASMNLKNAKELLNSYLQQAFNQQDSDWTESTLGKIAEFKNGLNYSKSSKGEVVKVAGVGDFQDKYSVSSNQFDTARIDGELDPSYELRSDDILTVRSNGNKRLIGRCVLVENIDDKASYSGFIIRIRIQEQDILPAFLTHYLKSPSTHELLIGSGEGANISNLNQKTLNKLPVRFPSKDEQKKICLEIEEFKSEINKLELVYTQKIEKLDELKKSILQKAFSGELNQSKGIAA